MFKIPPNNKGQTGFTQPQFWGQIKTGAGFTLIELLVAVAVFGIAVTISLGSVLNVLNANRKARSLTSVMNNLNFTLESMTREIRFGSTYHCGATGALASPLQPANCTSTSENLIALMFQGKRIIYRLNSNRIERSVDAGAYVAVTAPEINIEKLDFYVAGAGSSNLLQPRVIVVVRGKAGLTTETTSVFTIQTTISQRSLDF